MRLGGAPLSAVVGDGQRFSAVAVRGFGTGHNTYAHSMAWFDGRLYVGTTVHTLCLVRAAPPARPAALDPWPVPVPEDLFTLDLRAQIWRYDPRSRTWERVFISPVVEGRGGEPVARDIGYRGMAVCQAAGESAPSLYVATGSSASRGWGAQLLGSPDGVTFEPVGEPGLGDPDVASFRALVAFRGRLYTSPTGTAKAWNVSRRPSVLECPDPREGVWREVSLPGFGDPENRSIFQMEVFDGHLYAGTANPRKGLEVWKTDAEGEPPYRWKKVLDRGGGRGPLNEGVTSMCAFDGALYVGTGIQHGGYDRNYGVGPAAAEVLRIYPDDTWDVVVGGPRRVGFRRKSPLSGLGPGFGNFFIGYIWSMAAWEGRLYVGTFDSSTFVRFATGERVTHWLRTIGPEAVVQREGGFDLWCSDDGVEWTCLTRTGFDNPYNYGARTMVSSPQGLFIGTANPFGPRVAVRGEDGWSYQDNPRGGLEVWHGHPREDDAADPSPGVRA